MSYPTHRQVKLTPILADLKTIPGLEDVQQDDFDSAGIDVHGWVKGNEYKLAVPLQTTKAAIRKVCKKHGVSFAFTAQPEKAPRQYDGKNYDGTVNYVEGTYDSKRLSIVVYV